MKEEMRTRRSLVLCQRHTVSHRVSLRLEAPLARELHLRNEANQMKNKEMKAERERERERERKTEAERETDSKQERERDDSAYHSLAEFHQSNVLRNFCAPLEDHRDTRDSL